MGVATRFRWAAWAPLLGMLASCVLIPPGELPAAGDTGGGPLALDDTGDATGDGGADTGPAEDGGATGDGGADTGLAGDLDGDG